MIKWWSCSGTVWSVGDPDRGSCCPFMANTRVPGGSFLLADGPHQPSWSTWCEMCTDGARHLGGLGITSALSWQCSDGEVPPQSCCFCRITLISAELQWSLVTFKSSEISLGIYPSLWPLLSRIWTKASCSGLGKGQGKDYHSFSLISILSSRVAGSFVHRTG